MPASIHPSAIVEKGAELGNDVAVGAFAYLGARVRIGDGCRVGHHATVEGNTTMGRDCEVSPYAAIGGRTQDLKYEGGDPGLEIGDRNTFREFVTVHTATREGSFTRIGSDNNLLAYVHVAHECTLGNHIIISNNGTLGGHVALADHVTIGGLTAVHQFCRIGRYAMLGGCAKVVQDIPPYMIGDGHPARVRAVNKIGLSRHGFSQEEIGLAMQAFRILYREGHNRGQAIEAMRSHEYGASKIWRTLIDFFESSERGVA